MPTDREWSETIGKWVDVFTCQYCFDLAADGGADDVDTDDVPT